ncbi:hypothetical protein GGH91_006051, partial [Coemansia sp. RSA 2671]
TTNIDLLRDAGLMGYAREVHIGIERLRFNTGSELTDPCKVPKRRYYAKAMAMFNSLLLHTLPSLSKITFRGYG